MEISGYAYDGRSSERLSASLRVSGLHVELQIPSRQITQRLPLDEVSVSDRIGNSPRKFSFPDGYSFHSDENDAIDAVLHQHKPNRTAALIHKLESRYHYVLLALLGTVVFSWLFVAKGLPATTNWIAHQLPSDLLQTTGEQTLALLDKYALEESTLPTARQEQLTRLFDQRDALAESGEQFQVLFRKGGGLGANAFALPGGTIVFTDELVEKACYDEELLAIYGHEVGHLVHRHSLRHTIQGSVMALALALLIGDASAMGELLIGVPSLLIELQFSREFELEADQFAYQYMQQQQIPLYHFSSILSRISEPDQSDDEGSNKSDTNTAGKRDSNLESFFSTHPSTPARIGKFGEPRACSAQ